MSTLTRVRGAVRLPRLLLAIGLLISGMAAATGAMVVAQEDQPGEIDACVNRVSGAVRIVQDSSDCTRYETPVSWNQQGPEGPQGIKGDAGQACWDLNGNGVPDADTEDINGDGEVNIQDCQGPPGAGAGFTTLAEFGAFLAYAAGTQDEDNHTLINTLVVPAGTYMVDSSFQLFNFLSVPAPAPQHTVCYLTANSIPIEDTTYSATAEELVQAGPSEGGSGVTPVSSHFVFTFSEETTLAQHCFVLPTVDPFDLAGGQASVSVNNARLTAVELDSIDVRPTE